MQDEKDDTETGAESEHTDVSLCLDNSDEMPVEAITSTIQPTRSGKPAKRQKLQDAEGELLEKAIKCLDHATATQTPPNSVDSLECFGQYVASELRALDPRSQRWAKFQFQSILLNVSSQCDSSTHLNALTMNPFYSASTSPSPCSSSPSPAMPTHIPDTHFRSEY